MLRRSKTEESTSIPVEGAHLLVVDDDPDSRETMVRLFRHHGFEVSESDDPDGAAALVLHQDPAIDLVLIGFRQGGTSQGLRLLDLLRAHEDPAVAKVRAIMTTDLDENRLFSWQSGVDDFLIRPYHANDLVAAVSAALERPDDHRLEYRQQQMQADTQRRASGS